VANDDEEARVVSESGGATGVTKNTGGMELKSLAMEAMASTLVFPW
jgi:hypothetical protein